MTDLNAQALSSLELVRDIYVYGSTDEEAAHAAAQFQALGYQNVSELVGGLAAWKASGYPIEGLSAAIA